MHSKLILIIKMKISMTKFFSCVEVISNRLHLLLTNVTLHVQRKTTLYQHKFILKF